MAEADVRGEMPYRTLGRTGEKVSAIGLGGWHIGLPKVDEKLAVQLVREAIEKLGADPTALTPSANLVSVASKGVPEVLVDPRTNLVQCLEALMMAELTDNAGWELLVELAQSLGQNELAEQFEQALMAEAEHLLLVRNWLTAAVLGEARVLEEASAPAL